MESEIHFLRKGDRHVPKDVVRVRICNSITKIRSRVFMNCTKLIDIEFPDGLEEIGEGAFYGCDSLEHVWLPSTTRVIGLMSFKKCKILKLVAMNEGLERIMDQAFEACPELDNVSLPSTVRYLGRQAFRYCAKMKSVTLNEGLQEIKSHTFSECPLLERIALPASIPSVDDTAFPSTTIVTVNVNEPAKKVGESKEEESKHNPKPATLEQGPDVFLYQGGKQHVPKGIVHAIIDSSVKKIPSKAFENCKDLNAVEFTEGLEKIDKHAFANCSSLESVWLPSTTRSVGRGAFYLCTSLKDVRLNEGLKEIKQEAFSWCGKIEKVSLPSTVLTLATLAFGNCKRLKEVHLNFGLVEIGDFAFVNCAELEEIRMPTSVERVGREAIPTTTYLAPSAQLEPEASRNDSKEAPKADKKQAKSKESLREEAIPPQTVEAKNHGDSNANQEHPSQPVATLQVVERLEAELKETREELNRNADQTKKLEGALSECGTVNTELRVDLELLKDTVSDQNNDIKELRKQVADGAANFAALQESLESLKRQLATVSEAPVVSPQLRRKKKPRREDEDASAVPNAATSSINVNPRNENANDEVIDLT